MVCKIYNLNTYLQKCSTSFDNMQDVEPVMSIVGNLVASLYRKIPVKKL